MTRAWSVTLLGALLACSASPSAALAKDSPSLGLPRARPESAGMSSTKLAKIRPALEQIIARKQASGVVSVVARRGKVIHVETVGSARRGEKHPMREDTIFRIYSMTKPITTVAALILREEKKLELDAPVSRYLPEFAGLKVLDDGKEVPPTRPMTVRDLMCHTSGLTYGLYSRSPVDTKYLEARILDRNFTLKSMTERLGKIPLLFHPGEHWHYSVSVDVLARVVEVVTQRRFDRFLAERIFKPLGMVDTGFHVPPEKLSRLGATHGPDFQGGLRLVELTLHGGQRLRGLLGPPDVVDGVACTDCGLDVGSRAGCLPLRLGVLGRQLLEDVLGLLPQLVG